MTRVLRIRCYGCSRTYAYVPAVHGPLPDGEWYCNESCDEGDAS